MQNNIENTLNKLADNTIINNTESPVQLVSDETTGDLLLIYSTEKGTEVEFKYTNETLWMTQVQIADLFDVDRTVISKHLKNIYDEEELLESSTCAKVARVAFEGKRKVSRDVKIYDLNAIISVGYRVSSRQATLFRCWATDKLVQFATKGFVIDRQRLKAAEKYDHFKELREEIRDIRASEANIYREVRSICAMCQDYDGSTAKSRNMFALIQNKLLWASVSMTAPEIIKARADSSQKNMGLTNWPKTQIRKSDVTIAHNYLGEAEIKTKNRLTEMLLTYFEDRVERSLLTTLEQLKNELDRFIKINEYPLLRDFGSVKRVNADKHAHEQYNLFAEKRRALRHENP